jgi:drug/metabolite transporter (DMT)-like permease
LNPLRHTRPLALLGVLAISFSAIFTRLADVSPATAAFYRTLYALPVAWLIWRSTRAADERPARLRWMAGGAGLLLAVDLFFWHRSIANIGAGLATVLANTQVAFVGLLAWVFQAERPTRAALLLVPVMFVGVVLISGLGRADAYGADPFHGVVDGTLAGLAYAGFLLGYRASGKGQRGAPTGPLLDSTTGAALGALAFGMLEPEFALRPAWPQHGWLLALALTTQVLGWLLIGVALPRLAALETSVLLLLQPIGTVVWGMLIFSERLSATQWLGALIVLAGILLLSWRGSVRGPGGPVRVQSKSVRRPAAVEQEERRQALG